jgi:hypothetical protein
MKCVRNLLLLPMLLWCICASSQSAGNQAAQPSTPQAQVDVYHVNFNKAALGKAAEMGQRLSTPDPKAPMPGHFVVLRHQEGDDWDYCVIEHVGTKATVDPASMAPDPAFRELSAWHGDTFVSGPPWAEFVRAMVLGDGAAKKNAVYVVGIFRPASGHRDPLEQALKSATAGAKVPTGSVLMQHLEGAP